MGRFIWSIIALNKARLRKPKRKASVWFAPMLEALEKRLCPSVYYDFNVIAKVGQASLTNIEQGASINDTGKVAFVGDLAAGQGIFVGDGTTLTNIDAGFVSSTRTLGTELQINNSNQVAVADRLHGVTGSGARIYDGNSTNSFTNIAIGSSPQLRNSDFDVIASAISISNDGRVAFAGLDNTDWDIQQSATRVNRGDLLTSIATLPSNNFFRQESADNQRVVIAARTGATKRIVLYDNSGIETNSAIASTASGNWSDLGIRPGISDDGKEVAFYGNLTAAGATAINNAQPTLPAIQAGPGIFVSFPTGPALGNRVILRLVGNAGELGFDAAGNPLSFSSFDVDSRVAIIDNQLNGANTINDSFVVSFGGTPSAASIPNPDTGTPLLFSQNDGLWTIRLDVDPDLATPAQVDYHHTSPIPVVQVGDTINGSTVTAIATSDPLSSAKADWVNNAGAARTVRRGDHMIAFVATTASGNMVVRGSHLDSDQDGLLDHWETKGIDIDQDGDVDLDLKAMGANPLKRDIFLEADWTAPRNGPSAADKWSDAPNAGAFQSLVDMFKVAPALANGVPAGITVHVDAGAGMSINMGTGSLQGGDTVGPPGSRNTHLDVVNFGTAIAGVPAGVQVRAFDDIKKNFFGTNDSDARELVFHYAVFADFQDFIYGKDGTGATIPFTGSVSAATANTLTVTGTLFAAGSLFYRDGSAYATQQVPLANLIDLPGAAIEITTGTGAGQVRVINSSSASQLTLAQNWSTIPDATSTFTIFEGSSGLAEVSFRPDRSSIPGNDQIVSMGGFGVNADKKLANAYLQWRTVAHELGHTLGLRHGGTDHQSMKGNNYLSLMSYSWQLDGPPAVVSSYSGATDPTFNDWANLQLDFQDAIGHVGNSLVKGDTTVLTTDPDPKEQTVVDYQTLNNAPLDLLAPVVSIDSPAPDAVIAPNGTLTVNLTATDNVAVDQVMVSFDVAGDGTTADPGDTVVATQTGPNKYTATFSNIAGPTGPRVLTATALDPSQNSTDATESISVGNAPAVSQLLVSNLGPTNITAGGSVSFTITAQDSTGQTVPGYTGTVLLASTLGGIGLPAIYTFLPADNGTHTFALALTVAGNQTISVTDQSNKSLTVATAPITVNPGPLNNFVVSAVGGAMATAGSPFLVTLQATDQFGNSVSWPSGHAPLAIGVSPSDLSATVPSMVPLNSAGFGYFLTTLKTKGSYTLTTSDAADSIVSSSPSLAIAAANAVYFKVDTPATAVTNTTLPVTITALDAFNNVATNYTGTVKLTSTDSAAVAAGDLGGTYTFTSGAGQDNGVHAFNVKLLTNGSQNIAAVDTTATIPAILGTSAAITTSGLAVSALTKTPTGFTATFNQAINSADLTIYGKGNTQQDVLLVGQSSNNGQPYPGTLIVDASKKLVTFNVSSNFLAASNPGGSAALPDDTYTVTLLSGVSNNGFQDVAGQGLDDGHGGHADFTGTFTTTYQHDKTQVLGVVDFARGPNASGDTSTLVKVPNDPANGGHVGIPITIYNSANLTSAGFTLTYNANILTVTGGVSDPSDAAATFQMTSNVMSGDGIHSVATFAFTRATPTSGTQILGDITAYVPYSARSLYQVKDLLALGNITVSGGATVVPGNAVDVNAYFGDVNGDHHLDGVDKGLIANVASTLNTGFTAFTLLDPAIIGDLSGDNAVTANSTSLLSNYLLGKTVAGIPALPSPPIGDNLFTSPFASDPTLSLPASVSSASGVANLPIYVDHARPAGSTGLVEAELTLKYDPAVLNVSAADVTLGSIPSQGTGWQLSVTVNAAAGEINIQLYSHTPITADQAGSLVNIAFHVKSSGADSTMVQLMESETVLADDQAAMILTPGLDWTKVLTSDWVRVLGK